MTSMSVWVRSRTVLSMAALLALAACGGGGGGSSSSSGGAVTASVSGVASKGLLLNAVVTAYAVNADGSKGAKLASTTTSATDGSYSLTGLPAGVVVLLEVTPNAQGTTTMLDEATNVPVTVTAASGFVLRAATNLDNTGTTSAQITPFTDMAVKLAEGNGGLKPDVVATANGKVSEFAGISILSDKPTFATVAGNVVATNAAGTKLAALSTLINSGAVTGCSTDPVAGAACVLTKLEDNSTSAAVATALNTALSTVLQSDAQITDPIELAKAADTVTSPPTTLTVVSGAQTAIQEAKALINSVRTTAAALSTQSDATSLSARLKAVADVSLGVPQPLDDGTMTAIGAVSEALAKRSNVIANNLQQAGVSLSSPDWMPYMPYTLNQVQSGCKFYTDGTFTTLAYSGGVLSGTDYMGCRILQHVVWAQDPVTKYWAPSYAVFHRVLLSKVSATQFTVQSVLKKANVIVTPGIATVANPFPYTIYDYDTNANETPLSAKVTATVTGSATGASLTGEFAPGVESTWSYNAATGFYDQGVRALGTKQVVSVATSDTAVDANTTRRNFNGDLTVYDGSTVQSQLSVKAGSYVQMKSVSMTAMTGPTLVEDGAHLVVEGQVKSGYRIGGTLDLSNFTQTATRWGPNNGSFAGYITDVGGSAKLFDGTLTLLMPTDSGLSWDATLNGTLVTTGTNTLTVNLTAKQSNTVQGDLTLTGRYTQGSTTFLLTVLRSGLNPASNVLSFTTTVGGVGFVYNEGATSVDIMKGTTTKLGVFNVGTSRLVYADGTYEQF